MASKSERVQRRFDAAVQERARVKADMVAELAEFAELESRRAEQERLDA